MARVDRARQAHSPEASWLRRVCCQQAGADCRPERSLDVALVERLAASQRLAGRVGARIASDETFPAWGAPLVASWRGALGQQALVEGLLGELGAAARERDLPVLALKGADLRTRLYQPGERPSNDVDLLVPAARVDETVALLAGLGFTGSHAAEQTQREHWFATTFRHRDRPDLHVDLHWDLAARGRANWSVADLVSRSVERAGTPGIRVLGQRDLAVHLALHAVAFHGAVGRWIWWLDLWLLERVSDEPPDAFWESAARHARGLGGRVAVEASALRVRELFGESGTAGASPSRRARVIAALAARNESSDSAVFRRAVAALAVDRVTDLARALAASSRRTLFAGP